jgi:hypothetical protein
MEKGKRDRGKIEKGIEKGTEYFYFDSSSRTPTTSFLVYRSKKHKWISRIRGDY